jgi:hypothetical protein
MERVSLAILPMCHFANHRLFWIIGAHVIIGLIQALKSATPLCLAIQEVAICLYDRANERVQKTGLYVSVWLDSYIFCSLAP